MKTFILILVCLYSCTSLQPVSKGNAFAGNMAIDKEIIIDLQNYGDNITRVLLLLQNLPSLTAPVTEKLTENYFRIKQQYQPSDKESLFFSQIHTIPGVLSVRVNNEPR